MDEVLLPFVDNSPETIARKAAEKAAAKDRELARTQPRPRKFAPVRGEEKVPVRVGSIELPFFSSLIDPARVTGTHSKVMRQFQPRILECVACEYKKLETHLGDPAAHGLDPEKIRPEHRHHFGPGERDYTLCQSCYDTFGKVHPKMFELFAEKRMREDQQRSFRKADDFPEVAERVAEVDRWRQEVLAAREFGQVLEANPLGERRGRQHGGRYDGGAPTSRTLSNSPGRQGPASGRQVINWSTEYRDGELQVRAAIEPEKERVPPQGVAFMPADEDVYRLSDFTEQSSPESPRRLIPPRPGSATIEDDAAGEAQTAGGRRGRSRVGDPDPMWHANDAGYDPDRIGADHAEAIIADESWEARRTRIFRKRFEGIERALEKNAEATGKIHEKIEIAAAAGEPNPALQSQKERLEAEKQRLEGRREALYRRWDARLTPSARNPERAEVTSPFATVRKSISPYPRTTLHSGVDEWFGTEPPHVRAAHARHLAKVEEFLADAPRKLKRMGYSDEAIKELTSLPPLEPERLRRYPLDDPPLRTRLAAERGLNGKLKLAPRRDLVLTGREGARARRAEVRARDAAAQAGGFKARESADEFIDLAGRVHARDTLVASVREADGARAHVSRWAHTIHRAEQDLKTATDAFAREISVTFHNPRAFQAAFKQLSEDEKRAMLTVLRERPADFAREFRSAGGHDFGDAGVLAAGKRKLPSETTVGEKERSGILTAEAGVRYLDSVSSREIVRVQAASALGVPETTSFDGLRSACRAQMKEANVKKSTAITERASLGRVPSRKQLGEAFSGLTAADRTRVMEQIPGVSRLLEPRGRALARTGHSL